MSWLASEENDRTQGVSAEPIKNTQDTQIDLEKW